MQSILVTGAAGFIGSHTVEALLDKGHSVVGLDCLDPYYAVERKRANLAEVREHARASAFSFVEGDIRNTELVAELFNKHAFDSVVHLAALAGVRASADEPLRYADVNVGGTTNLLENARKAAKPPRFIMASTSSAYGNSLASPFLEDDHADRPLAPYPATKRSAELMGHAYHHLYALDVTVLRFFTVYGARGRPDMLALKVLESMFGGPAVPLFDNGVLKRDWTYVLDTVAGIVAATDKRLGYEIINLGRGEPVLVSEFIQELETLTGHKANLFASKKPASDVDSTCADLTKAQRLLGYSPKISVREGVSLLVDWYKARVLK